MKDDVNAKVTDLPPDADLVLDPNHPMRTARRLVEEKFTVAKSRTMHRHRGTFWRWDGACYREASRTPSPTPSGSFSNMPSVRTRRAIWSISSQTAARSAT